MIDSDGLRSPRGCSIKDRVAPWLSFFGLFWVRGLSTMIECAWLWFVQLTAGTINDPIVNHPL